MFLDIVVNTLRGRRDFADKKKGPIKKTTLTPTKVPPTIGGGGGGVGYHVRGTYQSEYPGGGVGGSLP